MYHIYRTNESKTLFTNGCIGSGVQILVAVKTAEQFFPVPFLLLVPRAVGDELLTQKLHNDPSEKSVQRESIRCRIR